jgi:hypothetical protein
MRFCHIAVAAVLAGCSSSELDPADATEPEVDAGTGGSTATAGGGHAATGGSKGTGGAGGTGGAIGTGGSAGTKGTGGSVATGGNANSGGSTGTGATGDTGGAVGSGGSAAPPDPCVDAGTCPPGTWTNVTPQGVRLDADYHCGGCNYGVQDVVTDPARPNDFYAFVCYQGVWKSQDYGLTWAKVSTGTNASHIESGRPWAAAIDPDPSRAPSTPPTLYTVAGYGDQLGVYKSVDGGVNFAYYAVNNTQGATSSDVYSLDVDAFDGGHLIAGFHDVGLSESKDGGQTWKTVSVPASFGSSVYVWFVRTGAAASGTWITEAQWASNANGMWRTTNAGGTWTQVEPKLEHGHGSAQIHQDGLGHIYAAGNAAGTGVIFRSADYGQTWAAANNGNVAQNNVFGTPNYVYATWPEASAGVGQHLQRSPAADGVHWSDWNPVAPAGMGNGAKRAAVTYDGQRYVIVTGNWRAGIWRYVE